MTDIYLSLDEVSNLEGLSYDGIKKKLQREPELFAIKKETKNKGKDKIFIALSSLSTKAQKAYKASLKIDGGEAVIKHKTKETPWYLDTDLSWFLEGHKDEYYKALDLVRSIESFIKYNQAERTLYASHYAAELGVSSRTLYRYTENLLEANAWALRLEREQGQGFEHLKALSLCRKPKAAGSFPSLSEEQRAVIENIWFDKDFADNGCSLELLYDAFCSVAVERDWESYPSLKTISRYVHAVMERRGAKSARFLAANGTKDWKNKKQLKCKRDASTLAVMEYVVADAHTFDLWVEYTTPNGKVKAIKPTVVAWEDMRSRCILGSVTCERSNAQVVKESVVKMVYSHIGGVPKHMKTDNGKDFTAEEMLGQNRKERKQRVLLDSEAKGFFLSIGATQWSRSLPYQPWDKPIERAFKTFCLRHSRKFKSYTGTLTASTTDAKRQKDIDKMLERGELFTLEEFHALYEKFLAEDYHVRPHRGLKDAGEQWVTPIEVFQNAQRYEKAAPPREYAAMLMMKGDSARVSAQGITKFKTLYTHYELCHYEGETVNVKWDMDDITKLYVYASDGRKICEAESAELLQFGDRVSQEALTQLHSLKNRQLKEMQNLLQGFTTPYEERMGEVKQPAVVGKLELTMGKAKSRKVVALPEDKEYRKGRGRNKERGNSEFLNKKAEDALSRLAAMGG